MPKRAGRGVVVSNKVHLVAVSGDTVELEIIIAVQVVKADAAEVLVHLPLLLLLLLLALDPGPFRL